MNQVLRFVCLIAVFCTFLFAAFAQKDDPKKTDDFNKIAKLTSSKKPEDREKAYQDSKAFLSKYGKDDDEKIKKIKTFVNAIELDKFDTFLKNNKTDDAFNLGKEILERDPNNLYVVINLAYAGFDALLKRQDDSFGGDSINFAQQALKALDEGKTPESYIPFRDQNHTRAWMYYVIGTFLADSDEKGAIGNFLKAASLDADIKNDISIYQRISNYYENMFSAKKKEYDTKHGLKRKEDAEMKADMEKMNIIIDRMIDIYARLTKYAETQKHSNFANWKDSLTRFYTFRKQSNAGLDAYLNNILNTPLPELL